jgi:subtilisin-like proprotein convertase family protein
MRNLIQKLKNIPGMKTLLRIIFPLFLLFSQQVYAQDVLNSAVRFNGTTSRMSIINTPEVDLRNGYTIEAWLYYEHVQGSSKVIYADTGSGVSLQIGGSGGIAFGYNKTATALIDPIPAEQWVHLAVTYDRTTAKVFLNGTQIYSVNSPGTISLPGPYSFVGGIQVGSNLYGLYKGMMDDLRVWTRAKTPYEINRDMYLSLANPRPSGSYQGLAVSVRFDRNSMTIDEGGFESGGIGWVHLAWEYYSNMSTKRSTYNSTLVLDGINSYCVAPPHQKQNASTTLTLEAWAKIDKIAPRNTIQEIFSKSAGSSYSYRLFIRNDSIATFTVNTGSEYKLEAVISKPFIWNHIAGTYNAISGKMNIYINGNLAKTENKTPAPIMASQADSLYIGKNGMNTDSKLKGQLDELRIWADNERTASQIKQYLHEGLNYETEPALNAAVYNFDGRTDDALSHYFVNPSTSLAFYGNAYVRSPKFYSPAYSTSPLLWQAPGSFIDNTWNLSLRSAGIPASGTITDSIYFASNGTVQAPKVMVLLNSDNIHKIKASLIAPDGTTIQLTPDASNAIEKSDLMTIFNDAATQTIAYSDSSLAPFSANIKPFQQLSGLNGRQRKGWWKLKIESAGTGSEGQLIKWGIQSSVLTSVTGNETTPDSYELAQNYPNPFNPATKIQFSLPAGVQGIVKLSVFDITGKEVSVLVNSALKSGTYEYTWNGAGFSSGIYFYTLQTNGGTFTKKMLLVK